jgi:hypothetical protein
MNEAIENKIIELIDKGKTPENSLELKNILESSSEAKTLYENLLMNDANLKNLFADEYMKFNNKIDNSNNAEVVTTKRARSHNLKPFIGFALAASLAFIAITFVNSPDQIINSVEEESDQLVYADFEEVPGVDPQPIYISGSEMGTLWSTASRMAKELGVDRYEIMYVVYEGNKDSFIDNNINMPRTDRDYFVDLSLAENLETSFVVTEVKRHIFCSC